MFGARAVIKVARPAAWHAAGATSCAVCSDPASTAGRRGLLPCNLPDGKSVPELD